MTEPRDGRVAIAPDAIPAQTAGTLTGLLRERAARTPDAIAYRWFDDDAGLWRAIDWHSVARETARRQVVLKAEGLRVGDRIVTLLPNGLEWVLFDQAAMGIGLVTVPLPPKSSRDFVRWAVERVSGRLLLVNAAQWTRLSELRHRLPPMLCVGTPPDETLPVKTLAERLPDHPHPLITSGGPNDLATIVFTSGTTGPPKGVMLSHWNLLSNAAAGLIREAVFRDDLFLSLLPLFHTLERTAGYYLPLMAGAAVAFGRGPARLREDMQALSPTIIVTVPRVLERMVDALRSGGRVRRRLLALTSRIGYACFEHRQGRRAYPPGAILWPLLRALLPRRLRRTFGGRLRLVVCGGAPLAADTSHTLIGLEVPIIQGYGLTEASPVVSVNALNDNDPDSVGRPLPDTEVRLRPGGELLVRGPGVMQGYWQEPDASVRAVDRDGWLHTGDLARLIDGRIHIVGRIKDIIVLSTGEKVQAAQLEQAITADPLFEQALVLGDNQPCLAALVVLAKEAIPPVTTVADPAAPGALPDPTWQDHLMGHLSQRLAGFPEHAQVRKALWLTEPWTVENDLLTHTMKARREKILARYQTLIDQLYALPDDSQAKPSSDFVDSRARHDHRVHQRSGPASV